MAWAGEDVTKLIRHIKKHPILYDRDLPIDAAAYAEAVEDVQSAVNKPWAMIKKKWSELRHYHKSIYLDYTKNKKQEPPKWKYYDMMAFAFDSMYAIQDDDSLVSYGEFKSKFESLMVNILYSQSDEEDTSEMQSDATSPFNGFNDENEQSSTLGTKRNRSMKRKSSTTPTPAPLVSVNTFRTEIIIQLFLPILASQKTRAGTNNCCRAFA